MTAKDLDDTLKTIAANAKALRDAGVVGQVTIGEVTFCLEGGGPPPMPLGERQDDEPTGDLDDPDTFGGQMPQRRRGPRTQDKE